MEKPTDEGLQLTALKDLQGRLSAAVTTAWRFAGIEGDHHRMWVIDQMIHHLLGDIAYHEFVDRYNSQQGATKWDKGTPP